MTCTANEVTFDQMIPGVPENRELLSSLVVPRQSIIPDSKCERKDANGKTNVEFRCTDGYSYFFEVSPGDSELILQALRN